MWSQTNNLSAHCIPLSDLKRSMNPWILVKLSKPWKLLNPHLLWRKITLEMTIVYIYSIHFLFNWYSLHLFNKYIQLWNVEFRFNRIWSNWCVILHLNRKFPFHKIGNYLNVTIKSEKKLDYLQKMWTDWSKEK